MIRKYFNEYDCENATCKYFDMNMYESFQLVIHTIQTSDLKIVMTYKTYTAVTYKWVNLIM